VSEPGVSVTTESNQTAVVSLTGEHDLSSSGRVRDALETAGRSPVTVLDLTQVEFLDSSILGVVVSAHREAEGAGRRLVLVVGSEPSTSVRRILELTGLSGILEITETRDQAQPDAEGASNGG
jgi:anti-sigma B factor antagonist